MRFDTEAWLSVPALKQGSIIPWEHLLFVKPNLIICVFLILSHGSVVEGKVSPLGELREMLIFLCCSLNES